MKDLALAYSAFPWAPLFISTNPVIPSSLRALATAFIQPPFFKRWPFLNCFFVITRPVLVWQRSFLVMPLFVYTAVPFHTRSLLPVWLFLVTRFGFRTFLAAALGALGFMAARRAFRATLRAARLALRGLVALRATVLTAIVVGVRLVSQEVF